MTVAEILAELRDRRVQLERRGDRLRIEAPRGALTDELREALTAQRDEILAALRAPGEPAWPPESLDAEQRFGSREARWYPFLEKRVTTPAGPGRLVQVFTERLAVVLEKDRSRLSFFAPSEVVPTAVPQTLTAFPGITEHWAASVQDLVV